MGRYRESDRQHDTGQRPDDSRRVDGVGQSTLLLGPRHDGRHGRGAGGTRRGRPSGAAPRPLARARAVEDTPGGRRTGLLPRPWLGADMSALISAMRREYPVAGLWPNPDVDSWAPPGWTGPRNENEADTRVDSEDRGWRTGEWLTFVVLERDRTGRGHHLCGHIGLKASTAVCRVGQSESAEVGLWTAPEARGHGIAPAPLVAVTGWAFDSFGGEALRRIEFVHDLDNMASCRVAEKSGYAFREMSPANPPRWVTAAHIHAHSMR